MKKNGKEYQTEMILIEELKPHPRNYNDHPDDQLEHIIQSIKKHGFYRNIVCAKDNTILAGHGVVKAALKMGFKSVPVIRLKISPNSTRALKILTGDNEMGHLSFKDDRLLSELLKEIKDADQLLGTGFDEMMLANFAMVTRQKSEIKDFNEAAQWVGMPEYEEGENKLRLVITFISEEERIKFLKMVKLPIDKKVGLTWSTRYPWTEREDKASVRWEM